MAAFAIARECSTSTRLSIGGWNARRIARDQTNKLIGNFTMARQTSAGIEQYEWFTAMDERVRETHAQNHGGKFYWNEPPATGHPGEDILCRCVAMAIIDPTRHHRAAMPANRPARPPVVPPAPKPAPKPKPKPAPKPTGDMGAWKGEWNAAMEAADARMKPWWERAFDKGADAALMQAVLFRARERGAKLVMKGDDGSGAYDFSNRTLGVGSNPLHVANAKLGTFRHEFGHYLDVSGALPHPRRRKQLRGSYPSTTAAKPLKKDHDNLPTPSAQAQSAGETAEDLYRAIGVNLDNFDPKHFEYQLGEHALRLHRGDKSQALEAVKQFETRIAAHLKSKGIDFPFDDLIRYLDIADPLERGWASAELAVHLLRGDPMRGIDNALEYGVAYAGTKELGRAKSLGYLQDYFGALTNNRYGAGHTVDYFKIDGNRLLKTDIGVIHERNLSEAFANYIEMRYDTSEAGKFRYALARKYFPETARRFDNLLDEIGEGKHPINSGRDYVAESKVTTPRKRGAKR